LNKIIASTGLVSRRNATELILQGKILINNVSMTNPTYKITPTDIVSLINPGNVATVIHSPQKSVLDQPDRVILLHKPVGYVCSKPFSPLTAHGKAKAGSETIYDVLPKAFATFLYVGRLDLHSSGLMLLTNKGDLVNAVTHPSQEIEKEYLVTTRREISPEHYNRLLEGIFDEVNQELLQAKRITSIPSTLFKPPTLNIESTSTTPQEYFTYSFVLSKGFKREIRRMVAIEQPNQVLALHRIRTGNVCLGDLPTGKYRELSPAEIDGLFQPAQKALTVALNRHHFQSDHERHPNNILPRFPTNMQFSPTSASSKMPPLIDPFEKQTRVQS
jgi:pseudouridine synthase